MVSLQSANAANHIHTYDKTLHFIFPNNIHMQDLLHPVVELVGTSSRCHDTELRRTRAIELGLLVLQIFYEIDAKVYLVRLKIEEIEPPSTNGRTWFSGKVDQLRK